MLIRHAMYKTRNYALVPTIIMKSKGLQLKIITTNKVGRLEGQYFNPLARP